MGDLPKEKGKSCLIVMGDLPKWKNDLIVMGDLPRKKNMEKWLRYNGWPTQKNIGEGSKAHSKGGRVRKRTTQEMVAQKRTWKEVGLENALPEKWWLNGALEMKWVHKGTLEIR
jgi:hypothetical protein